MKLKNLVAVLIIVLTLGVLFTGCGNTDTVDSVDDGASVVVDNQQVDNTNTGATSDDEVEQVIEDDLDEDVEIGSLI